MRKFLRRKQTGIPAATVHGWQKEQIYPNFFKIGLKASGLFEDEHQRVMELWSGGAAKEEIIALVNLIHKERQEAADEVRKGVTL